VRSAWGGGDLRTADAKGSCETAMTK
jgi:hypothetical protein